MSLEVDTPMTDLKSIGKGLVAGSFIILGLFGSDNMLFQITVFLVGVVVFIDGVMPFGSRRYIATVIFFAIIGALLAAASLIFMFSLSYGILIAFVLAVLYLPKAFNKFAGLKIRPLKREKKEEAS